MDYEWRLTMYQGNSGFIKALIKVRDKIRYTRYALFPIQACKDRYKWSYGRKADLKNPKDFDEKLIYVMYNQYKNDERVKRCIDKIEIHNYFRERGYDYLLNEVYATYNTLDEVDWDALPDSFVLKCSTGSGGNVIVLDKNKTSREDAINKLRPYATKQYGKETGGIQYKGIPARFLCERYIGEPDGTPPVDYKIYCCNGVACCIEVIHDRFCDEKHFWYLTDRDYNCVQQYGVGAISDPDKIAADKPKNLKKFIEAAELVSKEFPIVRVDLYNYKDEPVLGEMTFFPMDGVNNTFSREGLDWLGSKIDL